MTLGRLERVRYDCPGVGATRCCGFRLIVAGEKVERIEE